MQIYISNLCMGCFNILWKIVPKSTCGRNLSWFEGKRAWDWEWWYCSHAVSWLQQHLPFCDGLLWWGPRLGFGTVFGGVTWKVLKNRTKKIPSSLSRLSKKLKNNYVWHFPSLQLLISGIGLSSLWSRLLPTANFRLVVVIRGSEDNWLLLYTVCLLGIRFDF